MKSPTGHRTGKNNYWNPHQFKQGDRVICPDGNERTIKQVGVKYCVSEDGSTWLMKKCKPLVGKSADRSQIDLFGG